MQKTTQNLDQIINQVLPNYTYSNKPLAILTHYHRLITKTDNSIIETATLELNLTSNEDLNEELVELLYDGHLNQTLINNIKQDAENYLHNLGTNPDINDIQMPNGTTRVISATDCGYAITIHKSDFGIHITRHIVLC